MRKMEDCNKEIIRCLINILDPIGVIEIGPDDEYSSEVNQIEKFFEEKDYVQIKQTLGRIYGSEMMANQKKINEFIKVLHLISD